jgi:hypothetical protein
MRLLRFALAVSLAGAASTASAVPPRKLKPNNALQRLGITARYLNLKDGWATYKLGRGGMMELSDWYTIKKLPDGQELKVTTHFAPGGPSLNTAQGLDVVNDALHSETRYYQRPLVSLVNMDLAQRFNSRVTTLYKDGVARKQTTTLHFSDGSTQIKETADVGQSPNGPVPSMTSRTFDTKRR